MVPPPCADRKIEMSMNAAKLARVRIIFFIAFCFLKYRCTGT
jgi:hypothetical protein